LPQPITAERWRHVKAIVAEALEIDSPAQRIALARERCGSDAALLSEVESLLVQTTTAMEQYAANTSTAVRSDATPLAVGRRIGAYAIIRELGRGGMGTVYLAARADEEFHKEVAIKLLKRGTDTDEVLRRFRAEREILARLEHPNIARLIDGGTTDDGLPYFVMEYVVGLPVTVFCNEKALAVEGRLELFLKICSAVQFAHQNLVVHRDLKPANILVAADGEPKLLDFGIAKLLAADDGGAFSLTIADQQRLTPAYASPEQVRGEVITTVSDVYALGALLYEMLSGSTAHRFAAGHPSPTELLRVVAENQPLRPSAAAADPITARRLRGDLDNIVLMALRKEPARRYSGVGALAEDVRRHLRRFPVRARKDTLAYRASRFVQRNRIAVAAVSLLVLALIGGLTATAWEAHIAHAEKAKAEQRFNQVRELAHSVLFDYHDRIAALPGSTQVRELLTKDALKYLDHLSREAGGDQSLLREVATAYEKVGQIQGNSYYNNLGDMTGAMKSYRRSLAIRERLTTSSPANRDLQNELADSYKGIGDMYFSIGDLRSGAASYERAAAIRERVVASDQRNADDKVGLAEVYSRLGDIKGMEGYANLGDVIGALASYRKAEGLLEEVLAADPHDPGMKSTLGEVLSHIGTVADASGDVETALDKGRRAVAVFEELIAANPNNHDYQFALLAANACLRYALVDSSLLSEAIAHSQAVIANLRSMAAADPKDVQIRRSLSVAYNALGKDLLASGDVNGALKSHSEALSIAESILAADRETEESKSDVAFTVQRLGEAQFAAGDYQAALENYRKALAVREPTLTADPSNARAKADACSIYADLAKALAATGNPAEAAKQFNKAIPLAEGLAAAAPTNAKLHAELAVRYFDAGDFHAHQAEVAQSVPSAKAEWQLARDYFARSSAVWLELGATRTIVPINANKPEEVRREIEKCDAALSKLS
jgi:serine/threonine protein kinase/tetratricopeptide (TPR) repeat protein